MDTRPYTALDFFPVDPLQDEIDNLWAKIFQCDSYLEIHGRELESESRRDIEKVLVRWRSEYDQLCASATEKRLKEQMTLEAESN